MGAFMIPILQMIKLNLRDLSKVSQIIREAKLITGSQHNSKMILLKALFYQSPKKADCGL